MSAGRQASVSLNFSVFIFSKKHSIYLIELVPLEFVRLRHITSFLASQILLFSMFFLFCLEVSPRWKQRNENFC